MLVVLAVVVMVNYLSRDYFLRFHLSTRTRIELSPRTVGLLKSLTNQVKVTLYYDTRTTSRSTAPWRTCSTNIGWSIRGSRSKPSITCATPALAQKVKAKYNLSAPTDKNLVIFDCEGKVKPVDGNALANYVIEQVPTSARRQGAGVPAASRRPSWARSPSPRPCSMSPAPSRSRPISSRATANTKSTAATK